MIVLAGSARTRVLILPFSPSNDSGSALDAAERRRMGT